MNEHTPINVGEILTFESKSIESNIPEIPQQITQLVPATPYEGAKQFIIKIKTLYLVRGTTDQEAVDTLLKNTQQYNSVSSISAEPVADDFTFNDLKKIL